MPSTRVLAMDPVSSLYIHFPFCESKCHYCDFYSLGRGQTQSGNEIRSPDRFINALKLESTLRSSHSDLSPSIKLSNKLDTVFMGGGTPSMTAADQMTQALAPLGSDFHFGSKIDANTEWTMEANPSSITYGEMQKYRAFGINRISMGVQSMQDSLLSWLGRVHSKKAALQALEDVFAAGFTNVSVDLICGVPGLSLKALEESLEELTKFPITHLSCYLLTLPKKSPYYANLPKDSEQIEQLLFVHDWMTSRGFDHYEISNYAKGKNFRARHNLAYWTHRPYLGLGPSAHSLLTRDNIPFERFKNFGSLERYIPALESGKEPVEWKENLTSSQIEIESWMLALRLSDGFELKHAQEAGKEATVNQLIDLKYLEPHPTQSGRIRPTPMGFFLSDTIVKNFI